MIVLNATKNPMAFGETLILPGKTGELKPPYGTKHFYVKKCFAEGWLKKTDSDGGMPDEKVLDGDEKPDSNGDDKVLNPKEGQEPPPPPKDWIGGVDPLIPTEDLSREEMVAILQATETEFEDGAEDNALRELITKVREQKIGALKPVGEMTPDELRKELTDANVNVTWNAREDRMREMVIELRAKNKPQE